jgi:hypothetical protein
MHPDPFFLKNIQSSPKKNAHGPAPVLSDTLSNKLTIITPCCRQNNIPMLYASIQFDKIDKWIIVYDTSHDRTYTRLYNGHPQIVEVECNAGISGNPQRNYGMTLVDDGFIYFLDDDNIVHPDFWSIVDQLNCKYFYTFDQLQGHSIFYGNTIQVGRIDTAMFIVHKQHINNITWVTTRYDADGVFISDIASQNYGAHIYLNKVRAYYNFIRPT